LRKYKGLTCDALIKLEEYLNLGFYKFLKSADFFNPWGRDNKKSTLDYLNSWISFIDLGDVNLKKELEVYRDCQIEIHLEMESENIIEFWFNLKDTFPKIK